MPLTCRNLQVFRGQREAVKSFTHSFDEGVITALVGPNGSGKSSLLKAIYGYLQPLSGSVELGGRDVARWEPQELADSLGVCPQEAEPSLDFEVGQLLSLRYRGDREREHSALQGLAFLGLDQLVTRTLSQLSGGERQRVRLGFAMAHDPEWLILDEPANHLDLSTEWSLFEFLRGRSGGTLLALHDLAQAARFCHKLVVLDNGRLVAAGTPEQVLTEELLAQVFKLQGCLDTSRERPQLTISGGIK